MPNRIKKDVNYLQNLVDYVKKNLAKGYSLESLKWALINQGHSRIEVDKSIKEAQAELARTEPRLKVQPAVFPSEPIQVEVEPEPKSLWKKLFG